MTIFPRRLVVGLHVVLLAVAALFATMASLEEGPARPAAWGVSLAAVLLWVAAVQATLVPRRRRDLDAQADSVVVDSPLALLVGLVGAWFAMLVSVGWWLVVAVTDFGALENPGWFLVMALGALGSLPDLARLLTGRLRRWRLRVDADGVTYEGYRTRWQVPWSQLAGAEVQERPPGARVRRRGGGAELVPAVCFSVPPEQLAEVIEQRRSRAPRR